MMEPTPAGSPKSTPPAPWRVDTRLRAAYGLIAAVAVIAVLTVWAVAFERLRFEREQAVDTEALRNDNLAIAHEERASRSIDVFDQLLRGLRRDLLARGVPDDLAERMAESGQDARHVTAIGVLDANGNRIAAHPPGPAPNYADRAYFQHHAKVAEDRLHIGEPVVGKLSGRWVVSLSRRVEKPGGGFGGVVLVSVDAAFLSALYERSGIGPNGSLALIGTDGITRARRNGAKVSYGDDARASRLFRELERSPVGRYRAVAASDGVERIVSFRRMSAYPLVVVVASSLDDVFATVRDRERVTLGTAGAASVLVLVLAGVLCAGLTRNARLLATAASRQRRHQLLFENSFDAILRTRPTGEVLAANPAACAMFGLDEAALRERGREQLVDRSDPRAVQLLAERGRVIGAMRMRRGDGSLFEAEISSSVYVDDDGRPTTSMIVRDLTQRQAAELARAHIEARLRETQKLESIGTLAGGIAHDFNNILASILGNAAIAAADAPPGQAGADALARIRQAALRGRALVQKILTFSRHQPESREPVALQPVVEESLALLRATLPATVELQVQLPAEPLVILADSTQLQQVLLNLCTNAWQALPEQKGRVEVTAACLRADDQGPLDPPRVCLRVRDDGVGMDEATRARLFEPFFTTKPVGQGTGLGLSVVHGIVRSHGGTIGVTSAPGAGSTFEVQLPLAGQAAAAAPVSAAPALPATVGQGEHVVYVDDDEVVALTVESLLRRAGFRVTTFASAPDALAALGDDAADPDAVVTDYNMPGMSGLELVAALRRTRPGLPAILSSGYVSDGLTEQARALGVRHVLLKEYTLERLVDLLRDALDAAAPPERRGLSRA